MKMMRAVPSTSLRMTSSFTASIVPPSTIEMRKSPRLTSKELDAIEGALVELTSKTTTTATMTAPAPKTTGRRRRRFSTAAMNGGMFITGQYPPTSRGKRSEYSKSFLEQLVGRNNRLLGDGGRDVRRAGQKPRQVILQPELVLRRPQRADVEHELEANALVVHQSVSHGVLCGDLRVLSLDDIAHLGATRLLEQGGAFDAPVGQGQGVGLDDVILSALLHGAQAVLNIIPQLVQPERQRAELFLELHQRGAVVVSLEQAVERQIQAEPRACPDFVQVKLRVVDGSLRSERGVRHNTETGIKRIGRQAPLAIGILE